MTHDEVHALDDNALKAYAATKGVKGNMTRETILARLDTLEVEEQTKREHEEADRKAKALGLEKPSKGRAAEVEKLLKDYIAQGVTFEADDVAFTIAYRSKINSGSLLLPDSLILRQASLLVDNG